MAKELERIARSLRYGAVELTHARGRLRIDAPATEPIDIALQAEREEDTARLTIALSFRDATRGWPFDEGDGHTRGGRVSEK